MRDNQVQQWRVTGMHTKSDAMVGFESFLRHFSFGMFVVRLGKKVRRLKN